MIRRTENGEYGVVNDFDLAAIMVPGQESPAKRGFERTATKPFMALAFLLTKHPIQRRCSHDLESVLWCLAWYVNLGVVSWREGTFEQVAGAKLGWVRGSSSNKVPQSIRGESAHLWKPTIKVLDKYMGLQREVDENDEEYSDQANMRVIDKWLPYPKRPAAEE